MPNSSRRRPSGTSETPPRGPTTIRIELSTVEGSERFRGRPGVEVATPLQVVSRGADWLRAWNQIWPWSL